MALSSETWFPVVTLVVGAVLKQVFDTFSERRAERRNREIRHEQRLDALRLRRAEFQHATLLEFQEAIGRAARYFGKANFQDHMSFRETGKWRRSKLTEDVDQGIATEQAKILKLRVRINDQKVRDLAQAFTQAGTASVMAHDSNATDTAMVEVTNLLIALNERVGTLLREIENQEDLIVGD